MSRYLPCVSLFALVGLTAGRCALPNDDSAPFEGTVTATLTQGGETSPLLYTVSKNRLRIERTETNWPHPINIVELENGLATLVYPHNRSFVRLKAPSENPVARLGLSQIPGTPPAGNGSQLPRSFPTVPLPATLSSGVPFNLPPGVGPQAQPSIPPGFAAMPSMPSPFGLTAMPSGSALSLQSPQNVELKPTGETTNILGFTCAGYEFKQATETVKIWATDKLFPYHPHRQTEPPRFGQGTVMEQWPAPLVARSLFPLLAISSADSGFERFRFEVKAIRSHKITDVEGKLFQPPPDYHELQPRQF